MDWIGQRSGRLVVVGVTGTQYLCRCDCGREKTTSAKNFRRTRSCGCGHNCKLLHARKKIEMLMAMAAQQTPEQCQLWPGTTDRKGYGRIQFDGRWRLAHSVMWEVAKGPLSAGLTLDHYLMNDLSSRCSKSCVNLFHLEPVPNVVNVMRGNGACARHARQTHCKYGHAFTPGNTHLTRGGRSCRQCEKINYQRRQKEAHRERQSA